MLNISNIIRRCARLLSMCAFYAAQWREHLLVFVLRGDWRAAELLTGILLFSTGNTKISLTTFSVVSTPLDIAYCITGACDMVCAVLVIGGALSSHSKNDNNTFRSRVNISQFCLWLLTVYLYWMDYSLIIFQAQKLLWHERFSVTVPILIVVLLDIINIAAHSEKTGDSDGY